MTKSFPSILLALALGTSLAFACGGDDDDDMSDSANDDGSDGDDGDDGSGGDDGADDAPADDGADDMMDGGDAPSDDGGDGGGGGGLGADCTANSDCAENYCLMIEGSGGEMISFCSRQCVQAEDCPEEGWVCNLSPFTACVPDV